MHTEPVSVLETIAVSPHPEGRDTADEPDQRRPSRAKSEAIAACPGTAAGSHAAAAGSPGTAPADPAWWILHRLGAPQPFPLAGLPASAAPMVGDRTWRCR